MKRSATLGDKLIVTLGCLSVLGPIGFIVWTLAVQMHEDDGMGIGVGSVMLVVFVYFFLLMLKELPKVWKR